MFLDSIIYKMELYFEGNGFIFLWRIADILHGERQRRLRSESMEKGGRPFLETLRVRSDKNQENW